jgi:pimeloyl-ACP methyl ester carboxylesterase
MTDLHIETGPEPRLSDCLSHWRAESRHGEFITRHFRCRHFVWGQGPPLVFIHGLCDRAMSFVPMMHALRNEFQCIGYELPDGAGDGARIERIRFDDFVADLFALLDHLGISRAYLFGSSFGSTIAVAAMAQHPERIPRSVLQGGFAWRPVVGWLRTVCQFLRYGRGLMGSLPMRKHLHPRAEQAVFDQHGKSEMWNFLMDNSNAISKSAAARRGLMLESIDLRPLLPQIRQPILLISGDRDSIVPKECDQTLMNHLPHVDRVEIPDCGHYPQYTHAALTAAIVHQFLTAPTCHIDGPPAGCPHSGSG